MPGTISSISMPHSCFFFLILMRWVDTHLPYRYIFINNEGLSHIRFLAAWTFSVYGSFTLAMTPLQIRRNSRKKTQTVKLKVVEQVIIIMYPAKGVLRSLLRAELGFCCLNQQILWKYSTWSLFHTTQDLFVHLCLLYRWSFQLPWRSLSPLSPLYF